MVELIMQRLKHHFPMKNGDRINLQALAKSLKESGINYKYHDVMPWIIYVDYHGIRINILHYGKSIITSTKFFGREDIIEGFLEELWKAQIKKFIIKKKAK